MHTFLFQVLPIISFLVLAAGVVLITLGTSRDHNVLRFSGMGCIAAFVLLLAFIGLQAFARL